MSSSLTFVSQCVSRAALHSSRLPSQCSKLQHLSNNLVSKADTNLLYIGQDFAYSAFNNNHAQASWVEHFDSRTKILAQTSPYNLVIVSEENYSAKLLIDLKKHLAKHVILAVMNSRMQIAEKLLERSIGFVPELKTVSRVEIFDRNNDFGWDNGVLIYDILNKNIA